MRPAVTMEIAVDEEVLVDGSEAQLLFFDQFAVELATSINISQSDVEILGITAAPADGRRRAQTMVATRVDFSISSDDRGSALAQLATQLADEDSPLRNSPLGSTLNPTFTPEISFVCPAGMLRAQGANDCAKCPAGQRLLRGVCQDCLISLGQEPNEIGDDCQCMDAYYNVSVWGPIHCYFGDYYKPASSLPVCAPCTQISECMDSCKTGGTDLTVKTGWAARRQSSEIS
eukprot:SAG22_NODE_2190_length_2863_cov_1.672214_1_plen_230_part_10